MAIDIELNMKIEQQLDMQDCPRCHGTGTLEEEYGWCYYIACLDCGCHTAEIKFNSDEERLAVAKQVTTLWNIGKVLSPEPGE